GAGMTVVNSTFAGNSATLGLPTSSNVAGGGGIHTFTQPSAGQAGDSIFHNTIAGNSIGPRTIQTGGGLLLESASAPLQLRSTIIAGNTASRIDPSIHPDIEGAITSLGNNFVGIGDGSTGLTDGFNGDQVGSFAAPRDPLLAALANNGGVSVPGF